MLRNRRYQRRGSDARCVAGVWGHSMAILVMQMKTSAKITLGIGFGGTAEAPNDATNSAAVPTTLANLHRSQLL